MVRALVMAAVVCVGLTGCVSSWGPRHTEARVVTAPHDAGDALRVETSNGSVRVVRAPADRADVLRVDATLRGRDLERLVDARVFVDRESGSVRVGVEWPEGQRRGHEGCDLVVAVADAGSVVIRTSNDEIVAWDIPGPVIAKTSNDNIVLRNIGGRVEATTSNDDVVVVLSDDNPGPVRITTSNDDVELVVGPAFGGTLRAATSNGRVRVEGPGGVRESGGKTAELEFDRDGEASSVATSNSDIEITIRG